MDPFDPSSPTNIDRPMGWAMPDSGGDLPNDRSWAAPESGGDAGRRAVGAGDWADEDDGDRRSAGPVRLPVPLGPMTASDLLDGGFAILKARPAAVFGVSAMIVVPFFALRAYLSRQIVSNASFTSIFNDPTTPRYSNGDVFLGYVGIGLGTLTVLLIGCVISRMVSAWYAGGDVTAGEALLAVAKKLPTILTVWLAMLVVNIVGLMVLCVGWFFVNPLFLVVAPVIMIEDKGPILGLQRAVTLATRRYLWLCVYDFAATAMAMLADYALTALPGAIASGLPGPWRWIVSGAADAAVAILLTPAVAGVAVLVYLDLRVRSEGLDIEMETAEAFASNG